MPTCVSRSNKSFTIYNFVLGSVESTVLFLWSICFQIPSSRSCPILIFPSHLRLAVRRQLQYSFPFFFNFLGHIFNKRYFTRQLLIPQALNIILNTIKYDIHTTRKNQFFPNCYKLDLYACTKLNGLTNYIKT